MTRVAIMQPYFAPYLGYFRLFSETDLFVVLDTVQFPRRGWCHRNRFVDRSGNLQWLTLPLEDAPVNGRIRYLQFAQDAYPRTVEQMRRFPAFEKLPFDILAAALAVNGGFVQYSTDLLKACCRRLSIAWNVEYASDLDIPDQPAQDRIIAICKRVGAKTYVNSPGGRELYQLEAFAREGITLEFLSPWEGAAGSVLQHLSEKR